ncbi:AzlC family ABC transporter permease [Dermatobacter hominis]|uniref:AzlC family ABC transporter permease n=1 Tax=Dermatobacter hominis TaxID=2884263 RepID=UPI001D12F3BF|nr:AzlC family ABC transporter permease [Dermatobacter hominis]UDY35314.1 AzlC family ABC transporter permease [Dermatobacter hominis]
MTDATDPTEPPEPPDPTEPTEPTRRADQTPTGPRSTSGAADAPPPTRRSFGGFRAGAFAIAPLLLGVAPFGIVAGATPVTHGMSWDVPVGFSTVVFAGASQLASIEVLTGGGSVLVAVLAACTINLRMVLYSASMAPYVTKVGTGRRLLMAYLLTDQAYAVSIVRWTEEGAEDLSARTAGERLRFYLGAGVSLWTTWQISTIVGILVGNAVPPEIHLEFAVPLAFLVLLVPTLVGRPSLVAAGVGGLVAVLAAELGAGPTSIMIGSVAGIVAGALVDSDDPGGADAPTGGTGGGTGSGPAGPAGAAS